MPVSNGEFEFVHDCISNATAILHDIEAVLQDDRAMQGRHCCAMCIAYHFGSPIFTMNIGSGETEKVAKYLRLAQEKAARLGLLAKYVNHKRSRDSADAALDRWPGAIRGHIRIYSISGFPADVDEMFSFALAVLAGDLLVDEAIAMSQSTNTYFDRLKYLFDLKP